MWTCPSFWHPSLIVGSALNVWPKSQLGREDQWSRHLDPGFTKTVADIIRLHRENPSVPEPEIRNLLTDVLEDLVFSPYETLQTIERLGELDRLGIVLRHFGERSEESLLLRGAISPLLSGPLRHPSRPDRDLHLFALGILIQDVGASPTFLQGLPAHKHVEMTLGQTLCPDAAVAFDPQLRGYNDLPLTQHFNRWNKHVGRGAAMLQWGRSDGWRSGSRTPHTPTSALIRNRLHDVACEHVIEVVMTVPAGTKPDYRPESLTRALLRCSDIVNDRLRKWGVSNLVSFRSFYTYGKDLELVSRLTLDRQRVSDRVR